MTHAEKRNLDWLRFGGYLALAIIALPVLAIVAFIGRGLLLALAIVALVAILAAYAVSPAFRAWFENQAEPELSYSGLRLGTGLSFHPFHSWARIEGDEATVGADDLIQATLGPVDAVALPPVGLHLTQGEPMIRLTRGDRALELKAPVSGTVLSLNDTLAWDPQRVNHSPFGSGWLVRMRGDDLKSERKTLLRGEEARSWFRREVDRVVSRLLPGDMAPALPDGGVLVDELYRHIDTPHWNRLVDEHFGGERGGEGRS